jgi:hypothetical protein
MGQGAVPSIGCRPSRFCPRSSTRHYPPAPARVWSAVPDQRILFEARAPTGAGRGIVFAGTAAKPLARPGVSYLSSSTDRTDRTGTVVGVAIGDSLRSPFL